MERRRMPNFSQKIKEAWPKPDAVERALDEAPEVDEELSEEELAAIDEARADAKKGDFGVTTREIEKDHRGS